MRGNAVSFDYMKRGLLLIQPYRGETLASLNLTRRDILPTLTVTLTTIAFDDSSLQRFEAGT